MGITRTVAILMMIETISPNGKRVEAINAKKRSADWYPDEMEILARMVPPKTRLLQCPEIQNGLVFVVFRFK